MVEELDDGVATEDGLVLDIEVGSCPFIDASFMAHGDSSFLDVPVILRTCTSSHR
jgi:hypothetical protein